VQRMQPLLWTQVRGFKNYKLTKDNDFFLKSDKFAKLSNEELIVNHFEKEIPPIHLAGISGGWAYSLFVYGGVHKAQDAIEANLLLISDPKDKTLTQIGGDKGVPMAEQFKKSTNMLLKRNFILKQLSFLENFKKKINCGCFQKSNQSILI